MSVLLSSHGIQPPPRRRHLKDRWNMMKEDSSRSQRLANGLRVITREDIRISSSPPRRSFQRGSVQGYPQTGCRIILDCLARIQPGNILFTLEDLRNAGSYRKIKSFLHSVMMVISSSEVMLSNTHNGVSRL